MGEGRGYEISADGKSINFSSDNHPKKRWINLEIFKKLPKRVVTYNLARPDEVETVIKPLKLKISKK